MAVSAQYSVTIRVELDARQEPLGKLTASIAEAGAEEDPRKALDRRRVRRDSVHPRRSRPPHLHGDPHAKGERQGDAVKNQSRHSHRFDLRLAEVRMRRRRRADAANLIR